MATLGNSNQIIVGAAQVFVSTAGALEYVPNSGSGSAAVYNFGSGSVTGIPGFTAGQRYADTLEANANYRNVGYTMNGLELQFQPDFGEVQVDQLLDVARLYKQGMSVSLVTAFAEATLDNLVTAIAAKDADLTTSGSNQTLELKSGDIGDVPVERALAAVGPGTGDPQVTKERVYVANRALSIENVTVSAKRDTPSMFEVTFRLLSASNGSYGKIVDRTL